MSQHLLTAQFLPSPSVSQFSVGPLTVHIYALCILTGIFVAWGWGRRRLAARGGDPAELETMVTVAVVAGIVGARAYHVITDHQLFFGPGRDIWDAFRIWQGGLGIVGGVLFGAIAMLVMCRRRGWSFPSMADVLAPTLLVAQGIGRVGNWFNQELFGRPTTLPWGLEIDPDHRPDGYGQFTTFHPTFLYEMLWNFTGAGVLVVLEKRFRIGHGRLFMLYMMWYSFGRFWIEGLRVDPANQLAGMRVNEWVSIAIFLLGLAGFLLLRRGVVADPFPSAAHQDAEQSVDDAAEGDTDALEPAEVLDPESGGGGERQGDAAGEDAEAHS
ncbi:prolipoprotein diacylglyceryl transferase [Aestuariimicrobium sp. p3-SID1156]|nr:prolipoprotein diacylglyceryl transferase [Aestuariimicrobium sp. p3-SID1156]